jgi:CRISPR-associated protein Csb1
LDVSIADVLTGFPWGKRRTPNCVALDGRYDPETKPLNVGACTMTFEYDALLSAVKTDAALRRRRRLQPAGGPGDKIFPPTYPAADGAPRNAPPRHVFERRHIAGREVWCVLIDSVQSQANRLEEALLRAAAEERIVLPRIEVDFSASGLNSIGVISSLDAPHRVFDAILRDSLLEGKSFLRDHPTGQALQKATPRDASAILQISPSALLFGAWNSTGEGGGLGAKFARAIVSEIVGVDVPVEEAPADRRTGEVDVRTAGRRTGSRIDPLGVLRSVKVFKSATGWDFDEKAAGKGAKPARPSEINHGNIAPSVTPLGVTCAYAEQIVVITLAGLRRLRFGGDAGRDESARAMIAALGLVALAEQDRQGYALRSRCDLVCDGAAPIELVAFDGSVTPIEVSLDDATRLYTEAKARAQQNGFVFNDGPLRLTPQPKLVQIVRDSMNKALAGEGGEGDEGDADN